MGNILRKKRPPSEELDKLVLQISELEVQLKDLLTTRTRILRWLTYSTMFVIGVLSACYWLQRGQLVKRLFAMSLVSVFGGSAFFLLRWLVVITCDWFIGKKQRRIQWFTDRKLAIIEDVKANEKYNVARELIKKYGEKEDDDEGNKEAEKKGTRMNSNEMNGRTNSLGANMGWKKDSPNNRMMKTNEPKQQPQTVPKLYEISPPNRLSTPHRPAPIRPFVEQSRTPVDRILDFVMGESINNRYALICSNCHSHNGMALQEEFEHISFFCFKCNFFNPSKKEIKLRNVRASPKALDFHNYTRHENTDDSTENEVDSRRRPSTVSLQSDDEQSPHSSTTAGKER